jgi:undecaprenyl-diphosphatase
LAWEREAARRLTLPGTSRWRRLASLGAHLGDGALWVLIGGGLLVWGTPYLRGLTWMAAIAVLSATAIATAVKYLIRRPRPQELTQFYAIRYDRYSFPSGHATRMAAIAVVVGHLEPRLIAASYLLALLVALCRIMVGVHYPSDVLAGLLIGALGAWGVLGSIALNS